MPLFLERNHVLDVFSGTATYKNTFNFSPSHPTDSTSIWLDPGKVEVMVRVKLNGKDCGIVWEPPYRLNISNTIRPGKNQLEVDAVNLWINRMTGDEQVPEGSEWIDFETLKYWPEWFLKSTQNPSERYTFTNCRHDKKDDIPVPSGLIGPVQIFTKKNKSYL